MAARTFDATDVGRVGMEEFRSFSVARAGPVGVAHKLQGSHRRPPTTFASSSPPPPLRLVVQPPRTVPFATYSCRCGRSPRLERSLGFH